VGLPTGYPLALPLLPLAEYPYLLAALPYLTSAGLLVCLLTSAMSIAYYLVTKKKRVLILSACALFPFCIGWFGTQEHNRSPLKSMLCMPVLPTSCTVSHPWDCAQEINACVTEKLIQDANAQIVILPESSYPFELNRHNKVVELWSINALHKGQLLIIGAYSREGGHVYNGIYGIKECRVIFNYVKTCRMPFTEYVPFPWSIFLSVRMLFLKNKCGFSSKETARIVFVTEQDAVQLALCSEFFFDAYDTRSYVPLVVLVNDSWFSCPYIRRLMYLFARYTAIERSLDIIYTSYHYASYIMHP
jgi:apolipoprotein N-acyltransferase